jgi:hypothetical protein
VLALLDSFAYPADVLARARQPMKIGDADWRVRAYAVLEPALSAAHRESLRPLFALPAARAPGARERSAERLIELALGRYGWGSPWLRACALRALDPESPAARAALERASTDADPLVAETATAALARDAHPVAADGAPYLTVDKVLVLRGVTLFRAIPHQVLAGVAALLTERRAEPGERIVEKGELGDCLYVIAAGRVRVHDAERCFQELGEREVFGELSLLDAQPRAASVTAIEHALLLRLAQGDFQALMSERPDIMQAINRALCAMVRTANAAGACEAPSGRAAAEAAMA